MYGDRNGLKQKWPGWNSTRSIFKGSMEKAGGKLKGGETQHRNTGREAERSQILARARKPSLGDKGGSGKRNVKSKN